jgi:hypothetical protein
MMVRSLQAGAMIYIWLNALPIGLSTLAGLLLAQFILRPRGGGQWLVAAVAALWLGAILAGALILAPPKAPVWVMTIGSAVVIWAGFVAPVLASALLIAGQRWARIGRHVAWWLVMMVAQAVVMRLWGLVPPPQ